MKKLVFAFVAIAAMSFAATTTSCQKQAAEDTTTVDSVVADSDSVVADSDSVVADSVK